MHALKLSLIARFPSFIQSGNMFVHFLPRKIRSRGGLYIAQNGKTCTDHATEIASRRGVFSLHHVVRHVPLVTAQTVLLFTKVVIAEIGSEVERGDARSNTVSTF